MTYYGVQPDGDMGPEDLWKDLELIGFPEREVRFTKDPDWMTVLALVAAREGLRLQSRWRLEYLADERRMQSFVDIRVAPSGGPLFSAPLRLTPDGPER